MQDADQRKCVYIQLVDEAVWVNFKPDHFYDGVVRNFMFPLADFDESGSKYRQPLLIKDTSWRYYLGEWAKSLSTAGNPDQLPPIHIPVIWIRAYDDTSQDLRNIGRETA